MSYDLFLWKRAEATKTAMLAEVCRAICAETTHPAMAPFDVPALRSALESALAGDDVIYDSSQDSCARRMRRRLLPAATGDVSWLIVECSHSAGDQVARKVAAVAVASGLLMYDPQRNVVWGNTRPPSARRRRR